MAASASLSSSTRAAWASISSTLKPPRCSDRRARQVTGADCRAGAEAACGANPPRTTRDGGHGRGEQLTDRVRFAERLAEKDAFVAQSMAHPRSLYLSDSPSPSADSAQDRRPALPHLTNRKRCTFTPASRRSRRARPSHLLDSLPLRHRARSFAGFQLSRQRWLLDLIVPRRVCFQSGGPRPSACKEAPGAKRMNSFSR